MGHSKLTAKQESFASDIANKKYKFHWEAYAAHYNTSKMSQNTIYQEACRLLSNCKVTARIGEIEAKIKLKEKITLDGVLVKLAQRVNLDVREMYDDDDCLIPIKQMTQIQAMFISSFDVAEIWSWHVDELSGVKVKTQTGVVKKVKLESIQSILDMLMKNLGGYSKDNELGTSNLEAIRAIVEGSKANK